MTRTLTIAVVAWLGACASTSPQCVEDVSACIARCEDARGPGRDPDVDERRQDQTMTECEKRCHCRTSKGGGKNPQLKPTPTGM